MTTESAAERAEKWLKSLQLTLHENGKIVTIKGVPSNDAIDKMLWQQVDKPIKTTEILDEPLKI